MKTSSAAAELQVGARAPAARARVALERGRVRNLLRNERIRGTRAASIARAPVTGQDRRGPTIASICPSGIDISVDQQEPVDRCDRNGGFARGDRRTRLFDRRMAATKVSVFARGPDVCYGIGKSR